MNEQQLHELRQAAIRIRNHARLVDARMNALIENEIDGGEVELVKAMFSDVLYYCDQMKKTVNDVLKNQFQQTESEA